LVKLEREGLVIHERVGQENLPARNIFTLTQRGEEVFNQWLDHPVPHLRDMRLEFLAKVWFARQADPEGGRGLIEKQLVVCRERLNLLKDLQQSCRTQIEALSISFRLTMVEAAIAWLGDIKDATK
jgi:DNA-binding PadR family transcriptional regulator